jgi:hypothetical protein
VWDDYENAHNSAVRAGGRKSGPEVIEMMQIPEEVLAVEGTVTSEYTKSRRVREAEFLRFRQRFLQDADCPVQIPQDFSFSGYLTMMSAHVLTHIVEIEVYDWAVLWVIFLLIYGINQLLQLIFPSLREGLAPVYTIVCTFALLQVVLVVMAVLGFRALAYIRGMLVPGLDQAVVDKALKQKRQGVTSLSEAEVVKADQAVLAPPYQTEMDLNYKEEGFVYQLLSLVTKTRNPSKHEQLFGALGASGPKIFLHFVKLILLSSVVSIAALCVILGGPLWSLSPVLPFVAVIPALIAGQHAINNNLLLALIPFVAVIPALIAGPVSYRQHAIFFFFSFFLFSLKRVPFVAVIPALIAGQHAINNNLLLACHK